MTTTFHVFIICYLYKTESQSANAKTELNQRTTYPLGGEAGPSSASHGYGWLSISTFVLPKGAPREEV